ncbi:citryl-CoA lyase [Cupriavidus metallidurans]|uniref:citryl-CoA lyase n=1 Tax=Cupriavidus metallidurans TaxID=119219 RepID=UPI001CCE9389|nr:citryl-CoA lyase [Cupriavidus metallidurans]UBM08274.1 citryl-CoA lyase [Cupriavidus metallidurans]
MLNSAIGGGDADHIKVRGYDLVDDLMDQRDFIDVLCLEILGDFPDANLKRMINMFLVTSSDHGLTPSALSTRLTLHGAPESLQGAVAAGILGAGSRFLGTVEYSARFLAGVATDVGADWTAEHMRAAAEAAVARSRASGKRIPGIGHPIHVGGDPRCIKLLKVADECGYQGHHCALAQEIAAAATRAAGKPVPLNATGAKGAILLDMGMSPEFGKGLTLIGRVAGLVAHVIEEREHPIAQDIWDMATAQSHR